MNRNLPLPVPALALALARRSNPSRRPCKLPTTGKGKGKGEGRETALLERSFCTRVGGPLDRLVPLLFLLSACVADRARSTPPRGHFYCPAGLVHADVSGSPGGRLFVASSNWDSRYDVGTVSAVELDALALPALGAAPA